MDLFDSGIIQLTHDIQIAHRLYTLPGKCQQIHGHSMTVELSLVVLFNADGYAVDDEDRPLEFGDVKKRFRDYLDEVYDHQLLLNAADPFAGPIFMMSKAITVDNMYYEVNGSEQQFLPGLQSTPGDPSTENLAKWIATWCAEEFRTSAYIKILETKTNAVERSADPSPRQAGETSGDATK